MRFERREKGGEKRDKEPAATMDEATIANGAAGSADATAVAAAAVCCLLLLSFASSACLFFFLLYLLCIRNRLNVGCFFSRVR